jgi:hypothetical protein
VAQALGLNYTALKRRTLATGRRSGATPAAEQRPASFVEVALPAWPDGAQCSLELEEAGGAKLTVRLAASERATVLALAAGLWRQRR